MYFTSTKDNHEALVTMLLALTDQFNKGAHVSIEHAQGVLTRLNDEYERLYYAATTYRALGQGADRGRRPGYGVYDRIRNAMECYDKAAARSPPDNADAILRWNTCVRILKRNQHIRPRAEDHRTAESEFFDEAPL